MRRLFNTKTILSIIFVFLLAFSFIGCNSDETDEATQTTTTETTSETSGEVLSVGDIYQDLLQVYERINLILAENSSGEGVEEMSNVKLSDTSLPEGTSKYYREDILNKYLEVGNSYDFELYYGEVEHTGNFIEEILDFVEDNDGIILGECYYPNPANTGEFYKFVLTTDDYIMIQKNSEYENKYIKIGFSEDLLHYESINYSFDLSGDLSKVEDCVRFNYFEFTEDVSSFYINSLGTRGSYNYTSIPDNEQISLSYDSNIVEGFEVPGYILSYYNGDSQYEYIVTTTDEEVLSECYHVYNDNGYLYTYSDYDKSDDSIYINSNFIEATGWDYLIGSQHEVSDEIIQASGIFSENDTELYSGSIIAYLTDNYVTAQLRRNISINDLDEGELNLSNYGMYLDDEKAGLEYLHSIQITDLDDIKSDFNIKGMNLFNQDKSSELFNYLDEDIKEILTGEETDPIETTGDVSEFNEATSMFGTSLLEIGQITSSSIETTSIVNGSETITSVLYLNTNIDYNELYYYSGIYGNNFMPQHVILCPYDGKLVEFSTEALAIVRYTIYSPTVTETEFLNYLNEGGASGIENFVISVEKTDDYTFELVLDNSFYGTGVNMNEVFLQQGIGGFSESSTVATIVFAEDYSGYTIELDLTGLYLEEDSNITISVNTVTQVKAETFEKADPLDMAPSLVLPTLKEDIIFTFEVNESYNINYGFKKSYWIRMELEPGYYDLFKDNLYTVYDDQNNEIDINQYLIIEEAGTYYFELYDGNSGSTNFILQERPDRTAYEFDLTGQDGYIEIILEEGANDYYLNVPSASTDRLIKIALPDNENIEDPLFFSCEKFLNGATYGKDYWGDSMNIYFIIPANEELKITVGGYYFGEISFDYEYIDLPTDTGTMPSQDMIDLNDFPDVILTPEVNESRVNFTVTEAGEYRVNIDFYNFGGADVIVNLYYADGTILSGDCDHRYVDLEPGDYYYVFSLDEDREINTVVIIATIYFQDQ